MSRYLLIALLTPLLAGPLAGQAGLTIYSDGRVLVRRVFPLQIPEGESTHRLELGALDPGSVFTTSPGVTLLRGRYDAAVDEVNTMRRAVGRMLVFETGATRDGIRDTVVAEVLGTNPERFRLSDGRVLFQRPGMPRYPDDLVQIEPALFLGIQNSRSRDDLSLAWFTSGASWSASYTVVLGSRTARVGGEAVIPSATLLMGDAEVQLLAGETGRANLPMMQRLSAREGAVDGVAMASAVEQEIGESHLYTIPGRLDLTPGVTTTAALFEQITTSYQRRYVLRGLLPWRGPLMQYGEADTQPVEVRYLLRRPADSDFGRTPLPMGTYRLYEPDDGGNLQLIGETFEPHSAAGQDLDLSAGTVFDITARRVQTEYATRRDSTRIRATAGYTVTLSNAKDTAVVVEVLEERQGEWSLLSSSQPAERLSSTRTRFRVRVPAKGEATLSYRVAVTW